MSQDFLAQMQCYVDVIALIPSLARSGMDLLRFFCTVHLEQGVEDGINFSLLGQ